MKIAILFLGLWACSTTLPTLALPAVNTVNSPATPGTTGTAPATTGTAPATTGTATTGNTLPASPATPGTTTAAPAGTKVPTAPVDLVAQKYKVSFKLANVLFAEGLLSYETGLYQNYAGKIWKALMNLYEEDNGYREAQVLGFRNESGVIADVSLRFANETKNLISLDAVIKTGMLGTLPVDPASLTAEKGETAPAIGACASSCGAPQQCYPQCNQDCCGSSDSSQYMPPMPAPMQQSTCPGQCPSSCAPSCDSGCCGAGASTMTG